MKKNNHDFMLGDWAFYAMAILFIGLCYLIYVDSTARREAAAPRIMATQQAYTISMKATQEAYVPVPEGYGRLGEKVQGGWVPEGRDVILEEGTLFSLDTKDQIGDRCLIELKAGGNVWVPCSLSHYVPLTPTPEG